MATPTEYASVMGFIQFDPTKRDVNGAEVTNVTIRSMTSQELVNITIWPEFQLTEEPVRGDLIGADGKLTFRKYTSKKTGEEVESANLSATNLVLIAPVEKQAQ